MRVSERSKKLKREAVGTKEEELYHPGKVYRVSIGKARGTD